MNKVYGVTFFIAGLLFLVFTGISLYHGQYVWAVINLFFSLFYAYMLKDIADDEAEGK